MVRGNLYTAGEEFYLPNGETYVGAYHVHVTKGAMVGARHTTEPHDSLTPLTEAAAQLIETIQAQLKQRQDQASSPITSSVSRSSSGGGGSSSGGGGGGSSYGGSSAPASSY
tara:strand:+ start:1817 stop:2152 length:336 start_codon:yes stop_codon:yes gene_type:complete